MRARLLLLLLSAFLTNLLYSQILSGKITNTSNQPIAGASIKVVGGAAGTSSNVNGFYSLTLAGDSKYEIEVSAIGYQSKIISDIVAANGQFADLNIVLENKTAEMEGVVVTARRTSARMETAASAIQFQKNTNTVASVVSAESIKRSPDRNTGDVLKRTPGASLQDGRFLIVRGLADRYNQAMMNGVLLTSTEPDRKTFSFDLIPAQIIDNIIINKAFVPEYPGEWAGGLVQVNTKDIPAKGFFNAQIGTGFNTQTTFKKFYRDGQGGKLDWLGIDDGTRALPAGYTTKSNFDTMSKAGKIAIGKAMRNSWAPKEMSAPLNYAVQLNGGFNANIGEKKLGGILGLSYARNYRFQQLVNRRSYPNESGDFVVNSNFDDGRYNEETVVGAMASLALQLNPKNKVSLKSILNVNGSNIVVDRSGYDLSRLDETLIKGNEFTFRQNTFFNTQVIGEHNIINPLKFKWYGAFGILDSYVPDQRRLTYSRKDEASPWSAVISGTLSQQSGSHVYQSLNDYIYTADGDLTYNFKALDRNHYIKTGYMLQVKDRLYDAQLFAINLPTYNAELRQLSPATIFDSSNYGDGYNNKFAFDAIKNRNFRYIANTILNSGYIQFDNEITKAFRVVWGLRVENYDQLIGSVKAWDPRHTHSNVTDFLPGLNATYRLNPKTNIRLTASQTVVRPELRELSALDLYDFELNASVRGLPTLKRGKILNTDLRYELYPRAGETFNVGIFYKKFTTPIEQSFTEGSGGSSSFFFTNPAGAYAFGGELEFRKKLDMIDALKNFTFQSNLSVIRSRIQDTAQKIDRPLQGQSPYLINAGVMYDLEPYGLNITTLFNLVGRRVYLVGDLQANWPDIYEAPRPVWDFQVAKKVLDKKGELKLNITDILNRTQIFYQNKIDDSDLGYNEGKDAIRFSRKFGTTFSLSFNYSL